MRAHQLLLRRNSDWIKFTNAQLKREPEFSQLLFSTCLRSLSGGSYTFQRYRSTKRLVKIYKNCTVSPNWQYNHTANHKLICEDNRLNGSRESTPFGTLWLSSSLGFVRLRWTYLCEGSTGWYWEIPAMFIYMYPCRVSVNDIYSPRNCDYKTILNAVNSLLTVFSN